MIKSALILALLSASVGIAHAADIAKGKELVEKNNCAACQRLLASTKTICTTH
jgi:hypothetical protein